MKPKRLTQQPPTLILTVTLTAKLLILRITARLSRHLLLFIAQATQIQHLSHPWEYGTDSYSLIPSDLISARLDPLFECSIPRIIRHCLCDQQHSH